MKRCIYFRVDGGSDVGLGHLIRCMALAHMLKDDFVIHFYCKQIPDQLLLDIQLSGFLVTVIRHEKDFLEIIYNKSLIVVDGYGFTEEYQLCIKNKGGCLIFIDDKKNQTFLADMIINHAPGTKEEDYSAQEYTRYALGIEYALLRPVFLEQARKQVGRSLLKQVLICFGGSDTKNLTKTVLNVVIRTNNFEKIVVVTGPSYMFQNELMGLIDEHKIVEYHNSISEETMRSLMIRSDLAILPASGILFEALATGLTVISGYYVDNQQKIYEGFLKLNAIVDGKDFSEANILSALKKVRNENSSIKIIDGYSGERLREKIKKMVNDCSDID